MNERYSFEDDSRQLRAMVVDDSGVIKSQLVRIIQQAGCVVVGLASDGAEAVDAYKKFMPDFVTMDVQMPNMNGLEALKKIVEHDRGAVVIMVTTVGNKAVILEAVKAGAKNYILKPFTPESVKAAITKCFPGVALK